MPNPNPPGPNPPSPKKYFYKTLLFHGSSTIEVQQLMATAFASLEPGYRVISIITLNTTERCEDILVTLEKEEKD